MLSVNEVLEAFDAVGDQSMHNQVLKYKLRDGGYSEDEIASAIEAAILEGRLVMKAGGYICRPAVAVSCIARFSLNSAGKTCIASCNSDGSWVVAEIDGRVLAAPGSVHPSPMRVITVGHSVGPEHIAADLAAWAHGHFGAGVSIEAL
ncbi:hypothetical protein [Cupriavidus basilensis]